MFKCSETDKNQAPTAEITKPTANYIRYKNTPKHSTAVMQRRQNSVEIIPGQLGWAELNHHNYSPSV